VSRSCGSMLSSRWRPATVWVRVALQVHWRFCLESNCDTLPEGNATTPLGNTRSTAIAMKRILPQTKSSSSVDSSTGPAALEMHCPSQPMTL
jgi:hypothetical protein